MRIGHINILLIEDNEIDAETVKRVLCNNMKQDFYLEWVKTMSKAKALLKRASSIDVILLDLGLPDTCGKMDTLKMLENAKQGDIPTLVFTCLNDRDLAVDMVCGGADDYIRKSRISREPEALCEAIDFALSRRQYEQSLEKEKKKGLAEKDQVIEWVSGGYSVQR